MDDILYCISDEQLYYFSCLKEWNIHSWVKNWNEFLIKISNQSSQEGF